MTATKYAPPDPSSAVRRVRAGTRISRQIPAKTDNFWIVVPAGGCGTRLWPVSRSGTPKFLLSLIQDRRSLLQQTVDRLRFVCQPRHMMVVCGPDHAGRIMRQLPELEDTQIIVEPASCGTGPAIALAAALIERQDPNAIMGSFASDHAVSDLPAFVNAVQAALEAAAQDMLVTIGIPAMRPETDYGYISQSEQVLMKTDFGDVYGASAFVEKPDLSTAMEYVGSGQYLWNASMFIWRVGVFMEELRTYLPDVAAGVSKIADAWGTKKQDKVIRDVWTRMPNVSIDTGIMERSQRVAVVPASMGWSDIDDWNGLGAVLAHDDTGNSMRGDIINAESMNNVVWSDTKRVISIIGLDNIVIVDTPDALLVAERSQVQLVPATVMRLKEQNRTNLC